MGQIDFPVTAMVTADLEVHSQEQGVCQSVAYLSLFQILLSRYCESADVDVMVLAGMEQITPII